MVGKAGVVKGKEKKGKRAKECRDEGKDKEGRVGKEGREKEESDG